MSLTVIAPGLYTLPVDAGRVGHRALGVPTGGAADRAALALGNALVGNPPDACGLELTLAGPTRHSVSIAAGCSQHLTVSPGRYSATATAGRARVGPSTFHLEDGTLEKLTYRPMRYSR